MSKISDTINNIQAIATAPILNVLLLLSTILICASFLDISLTSGNWQVSILSSPRLALLAIGGVTFFLILIRAITTPVFSGISWTYSRLVKSKIGRVVVSIMHCKIEDISNIPDDSAIVLPANTSFIDDCMNDTKSALGSYVLQRMPHMIATLRKEISTALVNMNYITDEWGNYQPGTTIILPRDVNHPNKILITASSIRIPGRGFNSDIQTVARSIEQVFAVSANERISEIYMPVLGSGHGGLSARLALTVLLLAIGQSSKIYHHIKRIQICVLDKSLMSSSLMKSVSILFTPEEK